MSVLLLPFAGKSIGAQVTPPEEFLGYRVGADYKLTTYEKAMAYFELLGSESDRMMVREMGPTSMGRTQKYAIISSSRNMTRLERYREICERLSLARGVTPEEAELLAEEGRAVAWIDAGLHSTECAPSEHAIQLVYDLVTGEDQRTRRIRDNVITLVAFANPDGMTMVADWYMEHVGTEYEGSGMPWLYHKYVGHDNNRDSFNSSQLETQNVNRIQNHVWFPNVAYNHHQRAPFPTRIWIPPYGEPTNPNKPGEVIRWENLIGAAMGQAFEAEGKPGAISRISFDAWYPGFFTQIVVTHNIPSILTETALYDLATPHEYSREDVRGAYADLTKSAFYSSPWEGGWWRIGDAVEYCLTASKAVLDATARYRHDMLLSKYRLASVNIDRYLNEAPYGWLISIDQSDATAAARMLDKLMLLGVEVYRAGEPFTSGGQTWPPGTIVVPASQPFAAFLRTMMAQQDYPDLREYTHLWQGIVSRVDVDSGPLRPYDVAGWTLPVQMGVRYEELESSPTFRMQRLDGAPYPMGRVVRGAGDYILSPSDNGSFIAINRLFEAGGTVRRATGEFETAGRTWPAGTFLVSGVDAGDVSEIAESVHVPVYQAPTEVETVDVEPIRVGHYMPWSGSMDEGWMRWILEQYDFPYESLHNADIRSGNLSEKYSVITLASIGGRSIIEGRRSSERSPVPPEYEGGIEEDGLGALKEFVREGGTLVCNGSSADFAIESFGLPIRNVMRDLQSDGFYAAGSILRMEYDTGHPLAFGMESDGIAFFSSRDRVFDDAGPDADVDPLAGEPVVVGRFPSRPLLVSGYIEQEELIQGGPAVVEVPYGEGKLVLFGFSFHNRAQSHANFKLFFNALMRR
jgi:hypothetical protein